MALYVHPRTIYRRCVCMVFRFIIINPILPLCIAIEPVDIYDFGLDVVMLCYVIGGFEREVNHRFFLFYYFRVLQIH